MDKILSFFDFNEQALSMVFGRFGILVLTTIIVAYLVSFVILQITKSKDHQIGFSNWFKVCWMWGCIAAILTLGIIIILTIRSNGLYYFAKEAFGWSWYCGYVLMIPELILLFGWVATYISLDKSIKNSINQ